MMIERKCKMDYSADIDTHEFEMLDGKIQISDDARGRVYFQLHDGACIAVDLPDLLKAIQKAILVGQVPP